MKRNIPRIVLAGTNSGCGKTTVSCAVMQALISRGLRVGAFKCGPDYIDPMFHSEIIGAHSSNLDSFFFEDNTLRYLLAENGGKCDISIIEGVMGFYDGLGISSTKASTYEIAGITESPVVIVVDAKGASLSVMATIKGFLELYPDNNIKGVILNRCTGHTYGLLADEIDRRFTGRIKPLGYMPVMKDCVFESRHLGLITAAEVDRLKEQLQKLAAQAEKSVDMDGLAALADKAPQVSCEEVVLPVFEEKIKLGYAKDKAFCFYYKDSLMALEKMGATLVPFSPLEDKELPSDIQGVYFGGGYPELYVAQLSANTTMLNSIREALKSGMPCIAECGGFMYLNHSIGEHPMAGFLRGKSYDTGKLTRFGYVTLEAKHDNMLCGAGDRIPAHEFHHWDTDFPGNDFVARKTSGKEWDCAVADDRIYAGYPHFHFYANTDFAVSFYKACLRRKE